MYYKAILTFVFLLFFEHLSMCEDSGKYNTDHCKYPENDAKSTRISVQHIENGLHSMDPYHFDFINASIPHLSLNFQNVTLVGLNNCQITDMQIDSTKVDGGVHCNITLDAFYDGDGILLSQPFRGKGRVQMYLKNIRMFGPVDVFIIKGKDCERHWILKDPRSHFELKENAETKIEFHNLFDGDATKGMDTRKLIKHNPAKVFQAIGASTVQAIDEEAIKNINIILKSITF